MPFCAVCKAECTNSCSRCKETFYCSVKCQKYHWKNGHRSECNKRMIKKKAVELENKKNEHSKRFKNNKYGLNPDIDPDKFFKWRREPKEVEKRKKRRDEFYNWICENYKSKYNIFREYFETEFDLGIWVNRVHNEKKILFTEYDHRKKWSRWFSNYRSLDEDVSFIYTPYLFDGGAFILIGDSYITQTSHDNLNSDILRFQETIKTMNKIYICHICKKEKDCYKTCNKCANSVCNDCDQTIINNRKDRSFKCPFCRNEIETIIVQT